MKNTILILTFLSFYFNSLSQHIGVYYVGNIKQAPLGIGFTYHRNENDLGFFNNYKYGVSFTGDWIDAYENSGIYTIGSWGNMATGRTTQFITRDIFGIDVGITFKQFKFRPFVGGGPVFTTITTEKFIEAEDVSSGYNVLGYYWVDNGVTSRREVEFNLCAGTFYQMGHLLIGGGFDTKPRGVQLLVGIIF